MGTFIKLTPYHGIKTSTYYININAITSIVALGDGGSLVYTTNQEFMCLESAEYIFETMSFLEE